MLLHFVRGTKGSIVELPFKFLKVEHCGRLSLDDFVVCSYKGKILRVGFIPFIFRMGHSSLFHVLKLTPKLDAYTGSFSLEHIQAYREGRVVGHILLLFGGFFWLLKPVIPVLDEPRYILYKTA